MRSIPIAYPRLPQRYFEPVQGMSLSKQQGPTMQIVLDLFDTETRKLAAT